MSGERRGDGTGEPVSACLTRNLSLSMVDGSLAVGLPLTMAAPVEKELLRLDRPFESTSNSLAMCTSPTDPVRSRLMDDVAMVNAGESFFFSGPPDGDDDDDDDDEDDDEDGSRTMFSDAATAFNCGDFFRGNDGTGEALIVEVCCCCNC